MNRRPTEGKPALVEEESCSNSREWGRVLWILLLHRIVESIRIAIQWKWKWKWKWKKEYQPYEIGRRIVMMLNDRARGGVILYGQRSERRWSRSRSRSRGWRRDKELNPADGIGADNWNFHPGQPHLLPKP